MTTSHKQILKSSSIVGGAQIIQVGLGVIRTKLIALILGPYGVGLFGMYYGTLQLITMLTGFGLRASAVRNIAEAAGSSDDLRISKTAIVLRRAVWATGLLGLFVVLFFCRSLSQATFNSNKHSFEFAILSITLLTGALSSGQIALLQGLRRISWMAQAGVLGAMVGLVVNLPLIYFFHEYGIVPAILTASFTQLVLSWWFSRRINFILVNLSWRETFIEAWPMIRLGVCLLSSGLFEAVFMYGIRAWIVRSLNMGAVGQFQAAWSVSDTYLTMILVAMGSDFFPRLTAVNQNCHQMNRLMDEQLEITLLLGSPLVVGIIVFMPIMVWLFYSGAFQGTVEILRWQIAGTFFRLISWPLGFVQVSMGLGGLFVASEFIWYAVYSLFIIILWSHLGLQSTGIAFLVAYFVKSIWCWFWAWKLIGFKWSKNNLKIIRIMATVILIVTVIGMSLKMPWVYGVGGIMTLIVSFYSLYCLCASVGGLDAILRFLRNKRVAGCNNTEKSYRV